MGKHYSNALRKEREEISQEEKELSLCETISQLKENVRGLIESCSLSKGMIADSLGVTPSTVSAWLDRSDNGRAISIEHSKKLLTVVRRQPLLILSNMEKVENSIREALDFSYGRDRDPDLS